MEKVDKRGERRNTLVFFWRPKGGNLFLVFKNVFSQKIFLDDFFFVKKDAILSPKSVFSAFVYGFGNANKILKIEKHFRENHLF